MEKSNSTNKKLIKILRGSTQYDPSQSQEILADGQPFYSKKNHKFYVGDGTTPLKDLEGTELGLSLETGDGENSLKQDSSNSAQGKNSVALGSNTDASGDNQTVIGTYNVTNTDAAFVVGNGDSDETRSNAFTVLKDGRAVVIGTPKEDNDAVRKQDLYRIRIETIRLV